MHEHAPYIIGQSLCRPNPTFNISASPYQEAMGQFPMKAKRVQFPSSLLPCHRQNHSCRKQWIRKQPNNRGEHLSEQGKQNTQQSVMENNCPTRSRLHFNTRQLSS